MDIGEFRRTITVVPATLPIPRRQEQEVPDEQPTHISMPEHAPVEPARKDV